MRFNLKSKHLKNQAKTKWHQWFAWFPVRISNTQIAWFENVERQLTSKFCIDEGEWKTFYKYRGIL